MMNILVDQFPESVEIDGVKCEIRTDYRYGLRAIMAFEDDELASLEKQYVMLNLLYKQIPTNTEVALKKAIWFLDAGLESDGGSGLRLYSYSKDASYIFSAFRQTHGIDLETVKMHWWKFVTLFMDLGADTVFTNLISLRKRVKTGKASKEEKRAARDLGDTFKVPKLDTRTLEEKKAERVFLEKVAKSKGLENHG